MRREDAVQVKIFKAIPQHFARGLRGITVSPIGHAQPVAEFGMLMGFTESQADAADLSSIAAQGNREPEFVRLIRQSHEFLGILLCIGVSDAAATSRAPIRGNNSGISCSRYGRILSRGVSRIGLAFMLRLRVRPPSPPVRHPGTKCYW
jgi:hypothetical protein